MNPKENPAEIDQLIFEKIPLLVYLLPALFVVVILVFAVFGLIMNQLDFDRPKRFYNKLTLSENLQKHTFGRLLGCMILQFNPFFNFVFKPNFYMSRPLRLLVIGFYFLLISGACLLYFRGLIGGIQVGSIFWFGAIIQVAILLGRPKL